MIIYFYHERLNNSRCKIVQKALCKDNKYILAKLFVLITKRKTNAHCLFLIISTGVCLWNVLLLIHSTEYKTIFHFLIWLYSRIYYETGFIWKSNTKNFNEWIFYSLYSIFEIFCVWFCNRPIFVLYIEKLIKESIKLPYSYQTVDGTRERWCF